MVNQGGVEMRIAIIEDDEITRLELSKLLNTQGYETVLLTDFGNLTDELKQYSIELVLLDINLPYENGYEVCRKIKQVMPVPIIFVTSRDTNADELKSIQVGGIDFITKPYDTLILLEKIKRALQLSNPSNFRELVKKDCTLDLHLSILKYQEQSIEPVSYTHLYNQIKRGDIEGVKIGAGTHKRLADVPFRITSKTTGENHVVVTDDNGQFSTSADWASHKHNTNAGKTSEDGDVYKRQAYNRLTLIPVDWDEDKKLHHFLLAFETIRKTSEGQTGAKEQLQLYYEQLKQSILENDSYVDALLELSDVIYTVNLTKDVLERRIVLNGKEQKSRELFMDYSLPCSYQDYCWEYPQSWKFLIFTPNSYFVDIRHRAQKCSMIQVRCV